MGSPMGRLNRGHCSSKQRRTLKEVFQAILNETEIHLCHLRRARVVLRGRSAQRVTAVSRCASKMTMQFLGRQIRREITFLTGFPKFREIGSKRVQRCPRRRHARRGKNRLFQRRNGRFGQGCPKLGKRQYGARGDSNRVQRQTSLAAASPVPREFHQP